MSREHVTPRQAQGIDALLKSSSMRAAAKAIGISERTIFRWMQDPVFVAELRSAEGQAIGAAVRSLSVDLAGNFGLMKAVRDDATLPAIVRLRAAGQLDQAHRSWRELVTLEERLTELERMVGL